LKKRWREVGVTQTRYIFGKWWGREKEKRGWSPMKKVEWKKKKGGQTIEEKFLFKYGGGFLLIGPLPRCTKSQRGKGGGKGNQHPVISSRRRSD